MTKKIALVLAGGGSLGAYQIGAIKALTELGFTFDIVTGTSIGALNGAFYASGMMNEAETLWNSITANKVMKNGLSISKDTVFGNRYAYSLNDFTQWAGIYFKNGLSADITPFKDLIKDSLDVDKLKNSKIKLGIVVTKLSGLKPVFLCANDLPEDKIIPYLHASSACVPVFPPEIIDKVKYIDGFYTDNVPMTLAFEYGADEVITIDMRLFSLNPQHMAYLKYENVTYIAPYVSLGSLLNFEQEPIQKNITRGYHDVMKHFGKLNGFLFTFDGDFPSHRYFNKIINCFGNESDQVIELIFKDVRKRSMDDEDLFVRSLELLALELNISDDLPVYTYEIFVELIKKAIDEKRAKHETGTFLEKTLEKFRKKASSIIESNLKARFFSFFIEQFIDTKYIA